MTIAALARRVSRLVDWPRSPDTIPSRPRPLSLVGPPHRCRTCDVSWCGLDPTCWVCHQKGTNP